MRIKDIIVSSLMILAAMSAQAQITIGGNVYGGGNEGNVGGNTTVTVHAGDLNKVYGGARMADVGGRAFVNVMAVTIFQVRSVPRIRQCQRN